jgi:hypothetical protein
MHKVLEIFEQEIEEAIKKEQEKLIEQMRKIASALLEKYSPEEVAAITKLNLEIVYLLKVKSKFAREIEELLSNQRLEIAKSLIGKLSSEEIIEATKLDTEEINCLIKEMKNNEQ